MSKEIDTRFTVRPQSEGFEEVFFYRSSAFFLNLRKKKRNVKLSIFLFKTNHQTIYHHLELFFVGVKIL